MQICRYIPTRMHVILWFIIRNPYVVFILISGTELLKLLGFPPSNERNKGIICHVNEMTVGKQLWIRADCQPRKGEGLEPESFTSSPWVHHSCLCHDAAAIPKERVNKWRSGESGTPGEGMEPSCPFPIPRPMHIFHLFLSISIYNKPVI